MDENGHDALESRAFSLRSEQKGKNRKNRKNRDRDDGRPHNGVCVLGQHVAAAHAEESPGEGSAVSYARP
ncbi:MAG: hypothetical protein ABSD11_20560 [Methylocella sp.]